MQFEEVVEVEEDNMSEGWLSVGGWLTQGALWS
jgi:hypothetical protein